jgi:hypothetical protein
MTYPIKPSNTPEVDLSKKLTLDEALQSMTITPPLPDALALKANNEPKTVRVRLTRSFGNAYPAGEIALLTETAANWVVRYRGGEIVERISAPVAEHREPFLVLRVVEFDGLRTGAPHALAWFTPGELKKLKEALKFSCEMDVSQVLRPLTKPEREAVDASDDRTLIRALQIRTFVPGTELIASLKLAAKELELERHQAEPLVVRFNCRFNGRFQPGEVGTLPRREAMQLVKRRHTEQTDVERIGEPFAFIVE